MITASALSSYPASSTRLALASKPLKDSGIKVYVLGVGPDVDDKELNYVASQPQNVYKVPMRLLSSFGPALWDSWKSYVRNRG